MHTLKKIRIIGILLAAILPTNLIARETPVKIACIGNSITYGAFIPNREKNSYPAQLQAYLGKDYEVRNFGVSGSTLLSKGDFPYINTHAYMDSQKFLPDIVLIKLGTNDTKPQNWKYQTEFKNDYQKLINSYKALPSHPRIILLTPVRCFLLDESSINAGYISESIRPTVEEIAWNNNLEIINLFNLFGDQWQPDIMPDRIHPSSIGAGMMAKKIGSYLKQTEKQCGSEKLDWQKESNPFNFHGFQGYDFSYKGIPCKIVKPYIEAKGKPWVIRARFWGHEPQTDIELLEHGLHIAYCDVADLYGSDKAIARWDTFYQLMVNNGFDKKVVLEGMSRGGLIVYNWAAQNPEKVACIYVDAPVMDFKSWPMGKGRSPKYLEDTQKLLTAYGFLNEDEALKWRKNPIDHAKQIAKAKIPCLHIVGDADHVVPVDENTSIFEKEMEKMKCPITIIHKPEADHHPHSLNDPQPIVRFILSSIGLYANECTYPVPGYEYRSGAGWTKESDWHSVADDIKNTLKGKKLRLLLLGNSITQGWGGNRKSVVYKPGKDVLDQILGNDCWESAGISGDCTQNLLWRIRNEGYNTCHPDNVIIAIGINNLIVGNNTAEETAEGIIKVTQEAEKEFPNANIILLGLLPSGKEPTSKIRTQCDKIHRILSQQDFCKAQYTNPSKWFLSENGEIKEGLYANDYIHLTSEGYKAMAYEIIKLMK